MENKRILSGITSTGKLTLGNYLGAISNFIKLQENNELLLFIANLHAITTTINSEKLMNNTLQVAAWYFACGINSEKANVFVQSEILEHTQLSYILICNSYIGELERMTQFKDKSQKVNKENKTISIPSGLLIYPTLMAADILLYDADLVPVGSDQTQHLELTKNIALRMNKKYQLKNQELFKIPEIYQNKYGHKIMSLQEPTKKMSKSDPNDKNIIYLCDSKEEIINKIKKSVTDSENIIKFDQKNKPGVSNLLTIFSTINKISIEESEKHFANKNYGQLKTEVSEAIINLLEPIQKKYNEIINNKESLLQLLNKGAKYAKTIAQRKIKLVQDTIGINLK